MNWGAIAAFASLFAVLVTIVGASYTHGKLTQRVDSNEEKIGDLAVDHGAKFEKVFSRIDTHENRIGKNDVQIGRLEEWKDGFNAAARVSGNKEVA